ncbi:MAG TPA: protein kinase [Alphaproteobacteria bacterium]|jgi:hypothetical protein
MDERTNALPVGTELEGYRVVALLGAGGFGITYKAVDLLLDRHVAIKEYLPSVLANRGADRKTVKPFGRQEAEQFVWGLERFRTEAKTLVAFQHSNIVPVHRYFESNGTGYLVMAFQDGKSLADVIDAVGTLSEDELLTILRPLAAGLADVHAKGFLHRDIKPANIIIRRDGTPVLIDFGAARQAVTRQSRGLTAIVTEGYAPYEQYETDSHQGPWTDIYALGAVLYHCVTGRRPPESPKRIAAQLRKQPDPMTPAVQAAAGNYGESLLAAIDRALTVEEAKRPQSVREFMDAVDGRGAPAALELDAAAVPGGEAFMVEAPSLPLGRGAQTAAGATPADPASAEVAGNFMVEAPSAPLGRRPVEPAPPKQPLIARSRPSVGRAAEARAPEPRAPGGETLMVGSPTLIAGEGRQGAGTEAASVAASTQPPVRARSRAPAAAAAKRTRVPFIAGAVVVLLFGGGAIGYFAQRGGAPESAPPPAEAPRGDQASTTAPPPAAKGNDEALARSKAAPPEQIWQHHEGKTGQDVVRRIFLLPNDQLLIAGGRIGAEGANSDVWLWRFDAKTGSPAGERKSVSNARFDTGNAIVLRPEGGVAMAAARRNLGSNTIVAWVARAAEDGEVQWQHTFQEHALTIPYAMTLLANGDMIVVGSATEQGQNGPKGWAARISADGRVLWNKLFGKGVDDSLQSAAMLPDGGIIAVGWTNVERPAGDDRNLWILNLDGDGNVRWEKKDLGDEADEKGKAVFVAEGGDIVVLAEASRALAAAPGTAPRPAPPPGAAPQRAEAEPVNKPWLLRLAADGALRWDKRYSGGKDDRSDSLDVIVPAGDGGFFMAGSTESKSAGRKDGWLVRIDAEGAVLWDRNYGDQFDDEFTALTALADGGVLVGGSTALKIEAPAPPSAPPRGPRAPAKPESPAAEAKLWLLRLGYK